MLDPITLALLGVLAYRTYHGKGRLAEMLGKSAAPDREGGGGTAGEPNALAGMMGSLGPAAGALSTGLSDLLKDFQEKGLGETINSWVNKGPNQPMSVAKVEQALGPEKIEWLMKETGLTREKLLAGLSRELPDAVDKLTPEGRLPTEKEVVATAQAMTPGQTEQSAAGSMSGPTSSTDSTSRVTEKWVESKG